MLGFFVNVAMPTTLIVAIVPNILTPIMSLYGRWLSEGKYKELRKMYFFTLIGSAAVAGVFLLGFLLLGKFFMSFIYGKDIIPYLHYMYPLIITTTLYAITMCNTSVLIAMRSNAIVWISSALSCVVTAACCFLLVKPFGIEGLILTLGVAYALQIAVQEVGIIKSFLLQIKNPDLKEE